MLRKPESLSYVRAKAVDPVTIQDFFEKLGVLYVRLNLLSKPMQVYSVDESGLNITQHKGKVIANVKRTVASEEETTLLWPVDLCPRVRVSEAQRHSQARQGGVLRGLEHPPLLLA